MDDSPKRTHRNRLNDYPIWDWDLEQVVDGLAEEDALIRTAEKEKKARSRSFFTYLALAASAGALIITGYYFGLREGKNYSFLDKNLGGPMQELSVDELPVGEIRPLFPARSLLEQDMLGNQRILYER
jgi:hypothetical protein